MLGDDKMLAKSLTFGILGIEAYPVEIEADVGRGLPSFALVGLADTTIRESKERVRSAIKNSGFQWPQGRITINLAPSDIRKEGAYFDLPIALAILAASEQINPEYLAHYSILGELSLDGDLRPVQGVLPVALSVSGFHKKNLIVPLQNAREAALVSTICVWPQKTLKETVHFLHDNTLSAPYAIPQEDQSGHSQEHKQDFSEIKGQYFAKRAIEVAVSGGHNILLIGPPGAGKTMLAQRITTIMPDLSAEEALEVTRIHSVVGLTNTKNGIIKTRPFRNPHHSISDVALIGGGPLPRPGEISLAHHGVLFLDELPEFPRNCLEAMRQPLEDGSIRICRIRKSLIFPASFMLVAAMNPCPCGYSTDPHKTCHCNPGKIAAYNAKISGPLLDRIDIHIELPAIKYKELTDTRDTEPSHVIKSRVEKARAFQRERLKSAGIYYNAQMDAKLTKNYCRLDEEAKELIKMAMDKLGFSARAYDKILKVSRSIADLAGSEIILREHLSEAIQYRNLDKR